MTDAPPQVVALGHAIVDVLAPSDDELVSRFGLEKGTMTLVDDEQAEKIYAALGPTTEASGGSAANTAACLASFGADVQFVGKVRDDGLGRVFTHDIGAAGVLFDAAPVVPRPSGSGLRGPGTGRSLIMVTPDAEKTMCTNLGIGAFIAPADIDAVAPAIESAQILYIEGYLCGKPESQAGVERAIELARKAGTTVAFSGSDPAWVALHLDALTGVLDGVDVLFTNREEALGLARTDDLDQALEGLSQRCPTVTVTLGAEGSVGVRGGSRFAVPAVSVDNVVDTTGAGDSFAAGFLFGLIKQMEPDRCARLGALAAAEIVSHMGARPLTSLADRARAASLI